MPAFNSCTKCTGSSVVIHDRVPYSHQISRSWMRPQVPALTTQCSFDLQAMWVIDGPGVFTLHIINVCLYNQALADVRSTGAGINYLHCILQELQHKVAMIKYKGILKYKKCVDYKSFRNFFPLPIEYVSNNYLYTLNFCFTNTFLGRSS